MCIKLGVALRTKESPITFIPYTIICNPRNEEPSIRVLYNDCKNMQLTI